MVQSPLVLRKMEPNRTGEMLFSSHKELSRQVSQSDGSFIETFDSSSVIEPLLDILVRQFEDDRRKRKPYAMYFSGLLHEKGLCGFVKDLNKAAEQYHTASQANHAPATYALQKLYTTKNLSENQPRPGYLVLDNEEKVAEFKIMKLLESIAQGHAESEVDLSELCKKETACKVLKAIRGQLETEITDGKIVLDETLADNLVKLAYLIIAANTSENKESYSEAHKLISLSKDLNNSGALFYLSAMYRLGVGVTRSREEARACLEQSATLGNTFAMISLLSECINCSVGNEQMHIKGLEYALELSRVGSSEGFHHLGLCSLHGLASVQQDIPSAVKYFQQAAVAIEYQHSGHSSSESLFTLGLIYDSGILGLDRDFQKALEYYTVSVKKGNPKACVQLAQLYEKGHGVKQDFEKALHLLHKVGKLGQMHFLEGSQGRHFDPHLVAFVSGYGNYRNGRVLEKCGNKMKSELAYRSAMKALEFLVKNSYKSCAVLYFLGKLYHKGRGSAVCIETAKSYYVQVNEEVKNTFDIFEKNFHRKAELKLKEIEDLLVRRESSVDLSGLSERLQHHQMTDSEHLKLPKLVKRPVVSRVESFTSVDEREIDDILNSIDKLPGFEQYKGEHNEPIIEETTASEENSTRTEGSSKFSESEPVSSMKTNKPVMINENVDSPEYPGRRESNGYDLESNVTVVETLSDNSSTRAVSSLWSIDSTQTEDSKSVRVKNAGEAISSAQTELTDNDKFDKETERKHVLDDKTECESSLHRDGTDKTHTDNGCVHDSGNLKNCERCYQKTEQENNIGFENKSISCKEVSNNYNVNIFNGEVKNQETKTASSVENTDEKHVAVHELDDSTIKEKDVNKREMNGHVKEQKERNENGHDANMNGLQIEQKNKPKKSKSSKVCIIL